MSIHGLKVVPLTVWEDDRGSLFEAIHHYELPGFVPSTPYTHKSTMTGTGGTYSVSNTPTLEVPGRFGQAYVVHSLVRGTVRAFHKHHKLWDYFCIVSGAAKFAFVDDRGGAVDSPQGHDYLLTPSPGDTKIVVASARQPKLIVVPPGIFHGWVSLENNTTLLSIASELYSREHPDEVRVPPNYFDAEFGESPWAVKGR